MIFTLTTVRIVSVDIVDMHTNTIKSAQYAGSKRYQSSKMIHLQRISQWSTPPLTHTVESVNRQTAYSVIFKNLKQQTRKAKKLCVAKGWATSTIGLA